MRLYQPNGIAACKGFGKFSFFFAVLHFRFQGFISVAQNNQLIYNDKQVINQRFTAEKFAKIPSFQGFIFLQMFDDGIRKRSVILLFVYSINVDIVSTLMGPSIRTLKRWLLEFETTGNLSGSGWKPKPYPPDKLEWFKQYIDSNPCFYLEEIQESYVTQFTQTISQSTICRIIRRDLKYTRKKLTRQAREALPIELDAYYDRLKPFYQYPEQIIFADETSKDQRSAIRNYAWSRVGTRALVSLPASRGTRVSCFAAFTTEGFLSWTCTEGTFDRHEFHRAFMNTIYPYLNPWPLPRSILILDNAKIHMYPELEKLVNEKGAILIYLPPYSPQLNPIENAFALLKAWIQKHANLTFGLQPQYIISIALKECTKGTSNCAKNLFHHAGYYNNRIEYNERV